MKRIASFLIFFSLLYPCQAQSEWDKLWAEIESAIKDGSFDDSKYNLGSIFGGGDISGFLNEFLGIGGRGAFAEGGVFASGGIFDITKGGFFQRMLGLSFGFDEIHNDATLNSNMTWAIIHSKRVIHPKITEKQEKIMSLQDSINRSVKRLYELEQLTADYLSTRQSDAVDIEILSDLISTGNDIRYYFNESSALCNQAPGLYYVKNRMDEIVLVRSLRIITKFGGFARIDGNNNLLNNEDRNVLITNLINDMRDMRATLAYTYRTLFSAVHSEAANDIDALYQQAEDLKKK